MPRRSLAQLYREEFHGYSFITFQADLLAGLTVSAVALPLALAFGVASGANAAAGLVTAIISGIVIGALAGAPYQISGPTGAMSAVLVLLVQRYGLSGIWIAGIMAGIFLTIIGILRLGRFIAFIPSPVITGFTSGIALIIFIGQIDNFLGVTTASVESSALKFFGYFKGGFLPDWHAIVLGSIVILTMVFWPKQWNLKFPSSLLGIIIATLVNAIMNWPVNVIGEIPQTLLLADHFDFSMLQINQLGDFLGPALTITALGAIESLLCGAVGSNMTGIRLQANQELIAQGIGNIVIPFFGGVPATAAIARASVGIKSGGQTRMVSFIHSLGLLLSMFVLAPVMGRIPLAALAGVLMVTAWRMNEWIGIRFMFRHRFKTAMITFLITLMATVSLDLTQAILVGAVLSAAMFLNEIATLKVDISPVDSEKLSQRGIQTENDCSDIRVAFLTGPLFFAATGHFNEAFQEIAGLRVLILSMRGVPLIDTSGLESIEKLNERMQKAGGQLMFSGVHENVKKMMMRGGLVEEIGEDHFFWASDEAIVNASRICG
jgi:SulP family sulfate permease